MFFDEAIDRCNKNTVHCQPVNHHRTTFGYELSIRHYLQLIRGLSQSNELVVVTQSTWL